MLSYRSQDKGKTCNFCNLRDSMICDQIVFSTWDKKLRDRLLRESELTLARAVEVCQSSELARQQMSQFSSAVSSTNVTMGMQFHLETRNEVM